MKLAPPLISPIQALVLDPPAAPRPPVVGEGLGGIPAHSARLSGPVLPRLRRLCRALDFSPAATERAAAALSAVFASWGDRRAPAGWVSDITEDHSEVEFSISMHEGRPELRLMIEAQGQAPTVASQYRAALQLTERLGRLPGVDLARFRALEPLFRSEQPRGRFGLWHSICFRPEGEPRYKVYFNPLLAGEAEAPARVRAAMAVLGLEAGADLVFGHAVRDAALDVPKYFALDLDADGAARAKLYLFHRRADAAVLERAAGLGREAAQGLAARMMAGLAPGLSVLDRRPAASCFGFKGQEATPAEVNLYLPICAYARDDAQVQARVLAFLQGEGLDPAHYQRAVAALAGRPLAAGLGIHSYVAASQRGGRPRSTVYLSPELRRAHAPGADLGAAL